MRSFTGRNVLGYTNELRNINWQQVFEHNLTADPLISYDNTLSTKLMVAMNNHFPLEDIKCNKYKNTQNQNG